VIRFFCPGKAETKGSAKGFIGRSRKTGKQRAIVVNDNPKAKGWQKAVAICAEFAMAHRQPFLGPIRLVMRFQMERGKSVKRKTPCVKPDADKLARTVLDALTGIVYVDDGQVVEMVVSKAYDSEPGVVVDVFPVAA
jgi:Holliday junction resolvase RusA-like endonuclease